MPNQKKFLDQAGLTYLVSKMNDYPTNDVLSVVINAIDEVKQDKETGKGLSTNDFTNAYKNLLDNLPSPGDKNIIETIKVNNSALTPKDKAVNIDLSSYATNSALNNKVDKVTGKGLSTNDYTTEEKEKLAGIAAGAQVNVTYTASNGVTLTGANFTNSGVRSVGAGTANGTISVNTNGTTKDVAVTGLGNLAYKSSLSASDVGALAISLKGTNNGVAELDANGKVLSSQLPSYVDDVLEYNGMSNFPMTGESGKIYVDTATNLTYRWGGTAYAEISPSLALGETSTTAYRGDRGKIAYDHSQSTHARTDATAVTASSTNGNIKINGIETTVYTHPGSGTNPHGTTKSDIGLGNVGNFKAVSTVASQGLTDTEKSNARANIGAGTSNLTIGTTSSTAAAGNHTHNISLAAGGTATVDLVANTAYTLTAGGKSIIFKTPVDTTYIAATDAPGNIAATGAKGSSTNYARQDHTHGISLATGDANGQVKIAGSNINVKGLSSAAYTAKTEYLAVPIRKTITLEAANWNTNNNTYTLSDSSITVDSINLWSVPSTITDIELSALQDASIVDGGQSNGTATLKATQTIPTIDIPVTLTIIKNHN